MGYYVVVLLGLEEWMMTVAFIVTMAISVLFYIPVNILTKKLGKKKVLLIGFALFMVGYVIVSLFNKESSLPAIAQASIAFLPVAIALAIFGILPNTIVSDLAEYDTAISGEHRQGMFFAARSFVFKLGQSVAFLIIPSVASIGKVSGSGVGAFGVRLTAIIAIVFCTIGLVVFTFYDEKKILLKK
jgi:Na+/melibiose symporter-like transporter